MKNELLPALRKALLSELPGSKAHLKMMPEGRNLFPPVGNAQDAAVMILFYWFESDWHTILIQRTEYDGAHSGQISFPGGKSDYADADLLQTALRETEEEIGINPGEIKYAGKLTPLFIPVSNMQVHPFVGYLNTRPRYIPDSKEVDSVIDVPLKALLNPDNIKQKAWIIRGTEVTVPYSQVNGNEIWGATAMILAEFLEIFTRVCQAN
jgi:8-oxo-dGTP pyrophosphatase MutT (NUDIX family)